MGHSGIASANLESFRCLGYSVVDSDTRVVGVGNHRTDSTHSKDPLSYLLSTYRSRVLGTE